MVWSILNSKEKKGERAAFAGFVRIAVAAAMGCFFGCFRTKHSSQTPAPVVTTRSKNALSSLFDCNEELKDRKDVREEIEFEGLKNEAKFLKASRDDDISTQNAEDKSLRLNSWLDNASTEKLKPEKLSDDSSTLVKICEESFTEEEGSLEETPTSCMTVSSIRNSDMQNVVPCNSGSMHIFARGDKSVRFESEFEGSGSTSEIATHHSKQSESAGSRRSVSNSVDNPSLWKESKNEGFGSAEVPLMPTSDSDKALKDLSVENQMKYEAKRDAINKKIDFVYDKNLHYERTPGDRPILGMVAAHWNDNNNSDISPILWDGNGIPNSTNKYKEDQKISWHATPFEERLEKALSEETYISRRKQVIGTQRVEFDETEESDTALSQLQSSDHYKSVVSF